MFRDFVIALNMDDWTGVRLVTVSDWRVSGVMDDWVDGVVESALVGESLFSTNLSTSSFITRPSLPVPFTSRISTPWVFRSPRTAGVARDAYFDLGASVGTSDACNAGASAWEDSSAGVLVDTSTASSCLTGSGSAADAGCGLSSGYFASSTSISTRA